MKDEQVAILDASGKPARRMETRACPRCGAGQERRVCSSGFGTPHPICGHCGHEWHQERWEAK